MGLTRSQRNLADARALLNGKGVAAESFRSLRAVQAGRVFAVDANTYFARPSPSLAEGAALVALCAYANEPAVVTALENEIGFSLPPATGAWPYNRPCAQQYVGKSQSCMVISGRLIVHAPVLQHGHLCTSSRQTGARSHCCFQRLRLVGVTGLCE